MSSVRAMPAMSRPSGARRSAARICRPRRRVLAPESLRVNVFIIRTKGLSGRHYTADDVCDAFSIGAQIINKPLETAINSVIFSFFPPAEICRASGRGKELLEG